MLYFSALRRVFVNKPWFGNPTQAALLMAGILLVVWGCCAIWLDVLPLSGFAIIKTVLIITLLGILLWLRPFRSSSRLAAMFRWYVWLCVYFIITDGLSSLALYSTPFASIDAALAHADGFFGYNAAATLAWVHAHQWVGRFSIVFYNSLSVELVLLPFVLALLGDRKSFERIMIMGVVATVIGLLFYFFFPSSGTADVEPSRYYNATQLDAIKQFYFIQHHIPDPFKNVPMVSCPSFHTIWAIMIAFAFIRHPKIFVPVLIWNVLILISTLTTGWHFLVDVLAGIALSAFSIGIACWVQRFSIHESVVPKKIAGAPGSDWALNLCAVLLLVADVMIFIL